MIKYLRYIVATEYNGMCISTREHMFVRYEDAVEYCNYVNKHSDYVYNVFKVTLEKVENGNS